MNSPFLTLLELAECRECSLVVAEDGYKDQVIQTGLGPGQLDPPARELRTINSYIRFILIIYPNN